MVKRALLGQLSDTDIRLLMVYAVVVRSGGFSAAELELNIGRSTISRHIKDLEVRLGVVLCTRGRGGFSLTEEGRQVYESSQRLLAALDSFRNEVGEIHSELKGNLVVALFDKTVTNPQCHISAAIRGFVARAPGVELEMYVEPLNDIEKGVMDGRYHVGIIPQHRPSSSLNYQFLFNEPMHLYCGQLHEFFAMEDEELDRETVVASPYAGLGYHSPNMETGRRFDMQRAATGYDQEAIATMILSGCYVGYLPDHYAAYFVQQGQIRAILPEVFNYNCEFSAMVRRSPRPSRIVATFLEELAVAHRLE